MKNEFILHFSAIPIARLVPPPEKGGPVTGSLRDLYTLEWGGEHPNRSRRRGDGIGGFCKEIGKGENI